jgi:hypothetical protein
LGGDRNMSYLDSKRIIGTNTQRTGQDAVSGGWKEVGRTTLGSAGDTIDVSSLPDKRYYMVLTTNIASGTIDTRFRLGNGSVDTGSNYARRGSENGAADGTGTGNDSLLIPYAENGNTHFFGVHYFANKSDKEKLLVGNCVDEYASGSGNQPARFDNAGKWSNTSDVIDVIRNYNAQSGSFDTGSECVVLGYDPDDTHTTNFWEQLADVTLGSDASEISSGTITAKKYLWVQVYFQNASNSDDVLVRFNNDTGSNYAHRHQMNYEGDSTATSQSSIKLIDRNSAADRGRFVNFFAINHSAKEKLLIVHGTEEETSGANNHPTSSDCVGKWDNESSQITEIDCFTNSGNIRSGARLIVWGSD